MRQPVGQKKEEEIMPLLTDRVALVTGCPCSIFHPVVKSVCR
jgi:hypothetical protein